MRIIDCNADARHFAGTDRVAFKAGAGSQSLHPSAAADTQRAAEAA